MEGHLHMSLKERQKLVALRRVIDGQASLADAARQLDISYRQAARLVKRLRSEGDAGLIHKSRGKQSTHRTDATRKEDILDLYRTRYKDFGPTLAAEMMTRRDNRPVNHETLRLWLIEAGLWQPRKRRGRHHTWRKRKASFGELVQMDGSVHAWFEDRAESCFLMSMVDDATGMTELLFTKEETTEAAMSVLENWVRRYGIPCALYVDRKTVYVTDREPTVEEQLAGVGALTQFGRACQKLGIRIVEAHSPQAKGRVERKHAVCQDRLIKEMRLDNVSDRAAGNAYLPSWTQKINAQFAITPASGADLHAPVPADLDLRTVFCTEQTRTLGQDGCVRCANRWYLVTDPHRPRPKSKVSVQTWRDGTVHLWYKGRELAARELLERPEPEPKAPSPPKERVAHIPAADHYWRGSKGTADHELRQMHEEIDHLANAYLGPTQQPGT